MNAEPHWQDVAGSVHGRIPRILWKWIRLGSSMTRMLERGFGQAIQVCVLNEATGPLLADEARLLGTRRTSAQVREVLLQAGGRTVLAARTVYFRRRRRGNDELAALGNRPLGELLFSRGEPRWLRRQSAQLAPQAPAFSAMRRAAGDIRHPCWARRTVYLYGSQRLLVTEIFLPPLLRQRISFSSFS